MPPTLLLEYVNHRHIGLIQKKLFIDGTRSSNLEHAVLPYPLVDEECRPSIQNSNARSDAAPCITLYGRFESMCECFPNIHYIFSLTIVGSTRSSNLRMSLFVCSARLSVRIVWGKILARCAKYPLYMARIPSVLTVLRKQSSTPLYRLPV